jgi:cell division protein FtsL
MDVQSLFYTLGSVFLILGIVVMVAILVLIWKAYEAVQKTQQQITDLKENVTARVSDFADAKSTAIASTLGMGVASFIFRKINNAVKKD